MANPPQPEPSERSAANANAVAVISAYGAFRLLLIMLAVWTFFEGFALFTGGLSALSFGGGRTAERAVGAQMLVLVPIYGLLVWRRHEYRLLIWLPYAAQLAIILPTLWALLKGDYHGVLMLVVSLTFFVLLFYFWWHSHPIDYFAASDDEEAEDGEDLEGDEALDASPEPGSALRTRDVVKHSGRFKRRDR